LLTDNIKALAPEETWLVGQLEPIRALLRGPLDAQQLSRAESDLTSVIARHGQARRGLAEAKVAVKELLATLIDRIGSMGTSTGRFYEQVGSYQKQLESADDFTTLSGVHQGIVGGHADRACRYSRLALELVTRSARSMRTNCALRELEHELTQVSALVQKDPLTQALNRRGLEEAFRIETARATRYESPLVLAMLDVDDFKKLNDSLGHVAGDRALVHLAQVMRATLRPQICSRAWVARSSPCCFPPRSSTRRPRRRTPAEGTGAQQLRVRGPARCGGVLGWCRELAPCRGAGGTESAALTPRFTPPNARARTACQRPRSDGTTLSRTRAAQRLRYLPPTLQQGRAGVGALNSSAKTWAHRPFRSHPGPPPQAEEGTNDHSTSHA